ncbi:hypothetical protein PsYK624_065340 [Phanerochaete sordida]|uniref:Malate dehydrogenase n=1 Tax=Phanerochaete sordida TaxID=48140 RepID=A0A9P3LDI7_9APHY|nr:hypothetical protein PsYK624_065340 [Phanerochaete sordida]
MYSFVKLFSALALLALARAFPSAPIRRDTGLGSMCSTKNFDLSKSVPADIYSALPKPNTSAPTFVALSVGVQNYTCGDAGTWTPIGAITYLYDISCIPQEEHANFTTMVSEMWAGSPRTYTADDIVAGTVASGSAAALGLHFWVTDPNNVTSGKIFGKWDFARSRESVEKNIENTYVVCSETGAQPDPINPAINSPWLAEPVLYVDGKKDGLLADQVYRFNSNGGQAPNTTCRPGYDFLQAKSTLNFWLYGGVYADTIF